MQLRCTFEARPVTFQLPMEEWRADPADEIGLWDAQAGKGADGAMIPQVSTAALLLQAGLSDQTDGQPILLQISDDPGLALSRKHLLQKAGYRICVCTSTYFYVVVEAIAPMVHVAVFCQSIDSYESLRLAQLLLRYNDAAVLIRFAQRRQREFATYDDILQAPISPATLLQTMADRHSGRSTRTSGAISRSGSTS